ncbi:MAG: hypothetical protein H6895_03775 [Defluviimonas sp.]|uniref:hypothetical protein n=1 Tax=Albidovulum sp. TaxID=1872424 RepID=UPI001DFBBBBD|nr:hypothetical protein [Paracoccaceae bacterium]MCC0063190.1 hypothetical protein [Defluviimonas sp.]
MADAARMRVAGALALILGLAACAQPRAHAGVHLTPSGVRVVPSLSTSIAGVGVTVSQ